jgi:hypothetical protein
MRGKIILWFMTRLLVGRWVDDRVLLLRSRPLTRPHTFCFTSGLLVRRWLNPLRFKWPGPRLRRRVVRQTGGLFVSG